jgi:hypothetical protein
MNTPLNNVQPLRRNHRRSIDSRIKILYIPKYFPVPSLPTTAALTAMAGAAASEALMLRVGRRQQSLFLLILFTGWVLSPFIGVLAANFRSKRWTIAAQTALHVTTLFVASVSIAIYSYVAFGPPLAKPASPFLMVPLASWLLLAIAIPLAARVSKRSRQPNPPRQP